MGLRGGAGTGTNQATGIPQFVMIISSPLATWRSSR